MRPVIKMQARSKSNFWFACVDIDVLRDTLLSPFDKAVYGVICSHANVKTRVSTLSVSTIAKEASCGECTTQNCIKKLIERGILEREPRFVNGRQVSNLYRVVGRDAACYKETGGIQEDANRTEGACDCTPGGVADDTPGGAATAHRQEPVVNENQENNPIPPTPKMGVKGWEKDNKPQEGKNHYDTAKATTTQPARIEAIAEAYHRILPELQPLDDIKPMLVRKIEARIREDPTRQELSWWEAFFRRVRDFPCPMGLTSSGWRADFAWLVCKKGMQKTLNGAFLRASAIDAKFATKGGSENGWEIQKRYTREGGVVDARALLLHG